MLNHPSNFRALLPGLLILFCLSLTQPVIAAPQAAKTLAQNTPKSLYCVQGTVVVKGWERDLIRRDPALAKFHWSPIKAARPGTVRWPQPISVNSPNRFRPLKPTVMSFDEALAIKRKREAQNSSSFGAKSSANTRVNATVSYPPSTYGEGYGLANTGARTSTYASYSTSTNNAGYNYTSASAGSANSSQRVSSRVQGRLFVR